MKSLDLVIRRAVNIIEESRAVNVDVLNRSIYMLIQSSMTENFDEIALVDFYSYQYEHLKVLGLLDSDIDISKP
ncbi:MAG: hypothetical protein ABGX53_00025 [Candidatus Thioglobus sp.]|jgi:hypothetical protein